MACDIFYNIYHIKEAISSSPFTHYFDFCAFFALYVILDITFSLLPLGKRWLILSLLLGKRW